MQDARSRAAAIAASANSYASTHILTRFKYGVSGLIKMLSRGAYRILVGRPAGRRPLGKPKHRWEDNIKMDLQEVGWGAWTGLI
jgi:hypothetical protein